LDITATPQPHNPKYDNTTLAREIWAPTEHRSIRVSEERSHSGRAGFAARACWFGVLERMPLRCRSRARQGGEARIEMATSRRKLSKTSKPVSPVFGLRLGPSIGRRKSENLRREILWRWITLVFLRRGGEWVGRDSNPQPTP